MYTAYKNQSGKDSKDFVEAMDLVMDIDAMYNKLQGLDPNLKCMVRRHYDADTHKKLRDAKTKLGGTVAHCIVSAAVEPESSIGFLACDPEAYEVFAPLADKIIREYHKIPDSEQLAHPKFDYGDLNKLPFGDLDPEGKYVVSTRVRVGRTCAGFAGPPLLSKEGRNEIEARGKAALESLPSEYKGKYYPLLGMTKETQEQMINDHFLFGDANDKFNLAGGIYRDWPHGRGIYFNNDKNFLVWLNEEDHFRLISMEKGGNLAQVYKRLVKAIQLIEAKIQFAKSDRLGNLTTCPTNLGTSLRASVHARIPKLDANQDLLNDICKQYGIQPRGTGGEHTANVGGVYDLSNKARLGVTEVAVVKMMHDGVKIILQKEAELPDVLSPNPVVPGSDFKVTMTADEIFEKLQSLPFPDKCKHMVREFYTAEVHEQIKNKKTPLGGTVADCIISGALEPSASIAFMATDPAAYEVFAPLSDPIIRKYHKLPADQPLQHPATEYGNLSDLPFGDLDPENKYIVSTRIRVGRTASEYQGIPSISKDKRDELQSRGKAALESLPGAYAGKYYPLLGMDEETRKKLIEDHFMFGDANDKYNAAAGVYRDWPHGRGIFFNNDKTFLVWLNEEDHFRIISMEKGGNVERVYKRLVEAIQIIEKQIPFATSPQLGNLTTCPSNLGTSLRASVHAKIPNLNDNKELLDEICAQYNIQPRGTFGEHTENVGGVFDLSNKQRLGITELKAVETMCNGVKAILAKEAELEAQKK